ncbi:MAG: outer membrane protein assembly factor BamD [Candidatus Omnitrophica bacterium]|nr:outer membrane protein assembly factor BamD [Candidatus Omnitrophota bacterium]
MKKVFIAVFFSFLVFSQTYPFWIWSPKTQKWKNPQLSPLATPKLQLEKALKEFNAGRYKSAFREFKKVVVHYPDSYQASEARYYMGRCWEELKRPYQAFQEYQKVIDSYPNSTRIQEIIEREYKIGEYFLNQKPQKWFGISLYDLVEHPSIEIFRKIVKSVPYSEYAPKAQYKLGVLLLNLNRHEEAREAFQKLVDNYPDSEWVDAAKYQLATSNVKASLGVEYDDTYRKEAMRGFKEFILRHPEAEFSQRAKEHLKILREEEAKKNFDIAAFYEKQKKFKSAILYYKLVADNFKDTRWAKEAERKLLEIKDKVKK